MSRSLPKGNIIFKSNEDCVGATHFYVSGSLLLEDVVVASGSVSSKQLSAEN